MTQQSDHFGARALLPHDTRAYYRLGVLQEDGIANIDRLTNTIKVLLKALLRTCDERAITPEDVVYLAN